ncbi:hypothetical protein F5X68DRAFT_56831 [Plectosphaerella plurivora]|uniref:Uncharacterized protein n=1 Tax=Plectosphaerella plurivora TaxID=936078 RepID=A0A9P9ADW3_9PEZI|nr:hypothetical protein F5X68DRAFT_56831 [Plectosphaerella plurivora]
MLSVVSNHSNAPHVRFLELTPKLNSFNRWIPPQQTSRRSSPLLSLLSNRLILDYTAPYLSASARLNLASTNRDFRALVLNTIGVFRHLDLSCIGAAQLDTEEAEQRERDDDSLTEDEFYSRPLRGIFSSLKRHHLLGDVQTLILDGLSVTAELCHELILDPAYNIRVLSLRGTKNLNEGKLCRSLQYACRPTRPENTPRLKALYYFGEPERVAEPRPSSAKNARRQQLVKSSEDDWYYAKGRMTAGSLSEEWAATLVDCFGIIAFDTVACKGPRHLNSPAYGKIEASHLVTPMGAPHDTQWAVACYSLPPCAGCGVAPEGLTTHAGTPLSQLPALSPPPVLSSSLRSCTTPSPSLTGGRSPSFVARCYDCIRDRYCDGCHKWWCEDCYTPPTAPVFHRAMSTTDVVIVSPDGDAWIEQHEQGADTGLAPKPKARINRSCWECGNHCNDCIEHTQRICGGCRGGYCVTHNEGSTSTHCDWCATRGTRGRFLRQQ